MTSHMLITSVRTIKHMAVMENLKIKFGNYHIFRDGNHHFYQKNKFQKNMNILVSSCTIE